MSVEDHFNKLIDRLARDDRSQFDEMRHVRVETGFRDRDFIIYKMRGTEPEVLDTLRVLSFSCTDDFGASAEIHSSTWDQIVPIDYTPRAMWQYPVFMWLPLHSRIRWASHEDRIGEGSLGFPIVIRTKSRRHLKEHNVIYCETLTSFSTEFPAVELM